MLLNKYIVVVENVSKLDPVVLLYTVLVLLKEESLSYIMGTIYTVIISLIKNLSLQLAT